MRRRNLKRTDGGLDAINSLTRPRLSTDVNNLLRTTMFRRYPVSGLVVACLTGSCVFKLVCRHNKSLEYRGGIWTIHISTFVEAVSYYCEPVYTGNICSSAKRVVSVLSKYAFKQRV